MATIEASPLGAATSPDDADVVNNFSIQVATVNGSGSQSANLVLLRSIFQMGVPVSAKNLFLPISPAFRPGTPSAPPSTASSAARKKSTSSSR